VPFAQLSQFHNILPEATANVKIIGQKDSEERKGTTTGL